MSNHLDHKTTRHLCVDDKQKYNKIELSTMFAFHFRLQVIIDRIPNEQWEKSNGFLYHFFTRKRFSSRIKKLRLNCRAPKTKPFTGNFVLRSLFFFFAITVAVRRRNDFFFFLSMCDEREFAFAFDHIFDLSSFSFACDETCAGFIVRFQFCWKTQQTRNVKC